MSTFLSAYTINLTDPVETGRTKINYLISGDTSPFSIWSGTPETQKFLSVYRNLVPGYTNKKNYISYREGAYSGVSNFNFIPNGEDNLIDTTGETYNINNFYGSYNFINGISNSIFGTSSGNTTSGNTIFGSGNTIYLGNINFINGLNNYIINQLGGFNSIISSDNSSIKTYSTSSYNTYGAFNSLLSSYNSNIKGSDGFGYVAYNFISGNQNLISSQGYLSLFFNFIGCGYNNKIISTDNPEVNNFFGIINGTNNYIQRQLQYKNSILFGSNLTAISSGYSHFENLYVDENLTSCNIKSYQQTTGSYYITLDTDFTFHEIKVTSNVNPYLYIIIPSPKTDLQFLSLTIDADNLGGSYFFGFVDENNPLNPPTNISCKPGLASRFISGLNYGEANAYFFIWTEKINKWVMFMSDPTAF